MRIFLQLFLLLAMGWLVSCNSEEAQVKQRVKGLDTALVQSQQHIEQVFAGMADLQKAVSPSRPVDKLHKISAKDTLALFKMVMNYQKMYSTRGSLSDLNPKPDLDSNALAFFLNPKINPKKPVDLVGQLRYVDLENVRYVLRRMQGRNWPYFISNPEEWRDDESRDQLAAEIRNTIDCLSRCHYVIGVEEKLLLPGKVMDEQRYQPGTLLAKAYVYDLEARKIVMVFYLRSRNAFSVYTSSNEAKEQEKELERNLRDGVFTILKNELKTPD